MPLSSTHRCPSRFYARLMRPVTVLSTRPFTPSLLRLFTLAAIPTHKQPLQHPLLCSRRTARLPVLHKGHFPFVPSPYCFRQRSVAGCYGPYFANRGFHATTPAQKTLLTGAIVTIFFQCTRPVLTALPILWRWQWFKSFPKTMRTIAVLPFVGLLALLGLSYEEHPITGRSRLMLIDETAELEFAESTYPELLKSVKNQLLPGSHADYTVTADVTSALLRIVGPVRDWTLHVVDDDTVVNAFVTPSGKIFVYTGMLLAVSDLDELAAVLAHEIAHVLSRHTAEQNGFDMLINWGYTVIHSLLYATTVNLPMLGDISGRGVDAAKEIVTTFPYSRMCEKEADQIGLYLMSMAGFNPSAAIRFWNKLAELGNNEDDVPEMLSTHPSHEHRAKELQAHLPAALQIYHAREELAARFEDARNNLSTGSEQTTVAVVEKGVGRQHWHNMDEVNRALWQVLSSHIKSGDFPLENSKVEQEIVQETQTVTGIEGHNQAEQKTKARDVESHRGIPLSAPVA